MPKIVFMLLLCLLLAGCEAVGRGIAAELLDESRSVEKSGRCVVTGCRERKATCIRAKRSKS